MSFALDFGDLLPDTVTITTSHTVNAFGERSGGSTTTYSARIMRKTTIRRDTKNEEFSSPIQILLAATVEIPDSATVTYTPPGSSTPRTALPRSIEHFRDDLNLIHHVTLYMAD